MAVKIGHVAAIASVVLFAVDTKRTAALDRPLGVPLADEHYDDGPAHLAGEWAEDHDCRAR